MFSRSSYDIVKVRPAEVYMVEYVLISPLRTVQTTLYKFFTVTVTKITNVPTYTTTPTSIIETQEVTTTKTLIITTTETVICC